MDGGSAETALCTLYFIRHGETEVNRRNCVQGKRINPPLNSRGRVQAKHVGLYFRGLAVDWVVTSTSRRAEETGEELYKYHPKIPLDHYDELNELEFGELEGTHVTAGYNDLIEKWDGEHNTMLKAPGEHGESPYDCASRAIPCIRGIVDKAVKCKRKHVCVVIHSRLIQILMASLVDGTLDSMGKYKQKKAAINTIDVYPDPSKSKNDVMYTGYRYIAKEVNYTSHMPSDVVSRVSSATSLINYNARDSKIRFILDEGGNVTLKQP